MTLRSYLIMMIITTLACWGAFIFCIFTIDPGVTNLLGFFLFYTSFFLSLSGTAAILGFIIRFITLKRELVFYSVKVAFRQSFLFAFLLSATLFLLANNLFTWVNLFFLVIGLSVLEFFLISYGPYHNKHEIQSADDEL